ncbi:MAG TPA: histidine ammonia-lyase [Chloroflexi bacterium]|nr:histidine ammonia-lyase [Chloroflexota bacterium]
MIILDGKNLTIHQVVETAKKDTQVKLSQQAIENIMRSENWVSEISQSDQPFYGINTGFGIFSDKQISQKDIANLNRNLILSHAVGTGSDFDPEITRAAMLIRSNTLASGYSGIRLSVLEKLLSMLNKGVVPCIPSQGSLGSSGDLAPLSHLALVLTTDQRDLEEESGYAIYKHQKMSGKQAMQQAEIPRQILGPKEGLAITNGATFSAAVAALTCNLTEILLNTAEVSLAMSLEALLGASAAFDERLHHIRNQEGQIHVAKRIRKLTKDSTMLNAAGRVQDAYSLRCAPQVQGPARDTLKFAEQIITREINAVTDNPLIFGPLEAISGGNFHGEIIGIAMDYLKIALSEVSAISERRIFQLTDNKMNADLPPMLVDSYAAAGLNSGMMMPQYTAASLVLENQHMSTPDSINSLPTSGGKEDHNANSLTAARHAYQVAQNTAHVLAVELYCAARAIDIRLKSNPAFILGQGVSKAYQTIRKTVPYQPGDAWWAPEIEQVKTLVMEGELALNHF